LAADFSRFKEENVKTTSMNDKDANPEILQNVSNTLGTVLAFSFFTIVGFLLAALADS